MDAPKTQNICKNPAIHAAITLPNIIETGEALVINSSIALELFSTATFVTTS